MVVPTLLPNTTQAACFRRSMPALVKPRVATMTALEDCTRAVIPKPASAARKRVLVERSRKACSEFPAAALSPSVIMPMPSNSSPRPPRDMVRVSQAMLCQHLCPEGRRH